MERYERIKQIGQGSHGVVWKVQSRGGYRALKISNQQDKSLLKQESEILDMLSHPAIPTLYAFEQDEEHAYLMMEWMEGIPLAEKCTEELAEEQWMDYALQMLSILRYLHTKGILYLDLKLENILLKADGTIQLVDFSCAQELDHQDPILHYGTYGFAPPEQYVEGYLDERADIYAFGKVVMALSLGIYNGELLDSYCVEDLCVSDAWKRILQRCTNEDPSLRYDSCTALMEDIHQLQERAQWKTYLYVSTSPWWKALWLLIMGVLLCGCNSCLPFGYL